LQQSKESIHRRAQRVESENKRMRDDLVSLAGMARDPARRLPSDLVRRVVERALGGSDETRLAVVDLDALVQSARQVKQAEEIDL
jgi:hypothetical protein